MPERERGAGPGFSVMPAANLVLPALLVVEQPNLTLQASIANDVSPRCSHRVGKVVASIDLAFVNRRIPDRLACVGQGR